MDKKIDTNKKVDCRACGGVRTIYIVVSLIYMNGKPVIDGIYRECKACK